MRPRTGLFSRTTGQAGSGSFPFLFGRADVVTQHDILIPKVHCAVGDNGVRPGLDLAAIWLGEAAMFAIGLGSGLDQRNVGVETSGVDPTVGITQRRLADRAFLPFHLAGGEFGTEYRVARTPVKV